MREIYLDDYHLHSLTADLPTRVSRGVEGLAAPDQRIDAYDNPGTDGQTVANVLHGGRLVTLEGWIHGSSEAQYRANRAAFHRLVGANRNALGQVLPRILKLTDPTGAQYRLNCVVRSLKNPEELPTSSHWQLQLLATDYLLYAEDEQSLTVSLPVSGGVTFPFVFPVTFGLSSGGGSIVTNNGTMDTAPTVMLYGPMQNPRLYNDTTGQVLGVDVTLVQGDVITVNMARRTVIQGTSTNRMGSLTIGSKFWRLVPGTNTLRLTAAAFDGGDATITWRDAYLGL